MTVRESEWTPDQVARLIAARLAAADMGTHGIPMSEATDPANQFAFEGYEKPVVDFAAKAAGDRRDAFMKKYPGVNTNGFLWGVRRRAD